MFDLLKVSALKFPDTFQSIRYKKDPSWIEFEGEKPYDFETDSELVSYEDLLAEAEVWHSQGLLADWEVFIDELPTNPLVMHLVMNRQLSSELHLALMDLFVLSSYPSFRTPPVIGSFWQSLLIACENTEGLVITDDLRIPWNEAADRNCLPDFFTLSLES